MRSRVSPRRDAGDRLENALDVKAAQPDVDGQRVQAGRLLRPLDDPAKFGHQRRMSCGQGRLIGYYSNGQTQVLDTLRVSMFNAALLVR